ncbi:hypothetical protein [Candidatus Albibeggiatoa sp. nov. BB20]|uniref:hypothetical protein n=1 Tax=Candidatus Albibeggiatoa sp. nov. BB20 TaxID=3162723 RepID=UPI003365B125
MEFSNARVIIYHKQKTSAKTLFLSINKSVCLFDGLPDLSSLLDLDAVSDDKVALHPAAIISDAEQRLGLDKGSLELDSEFQAVVDAPDQNLTIFLLRTMYVDPPCDEVAEHEGRFIAITDARTYPQTELELLRRAYEAIMEG